MATFAQRIPAMVAVLVAAAAGPAHGQGATSRSSSQDSVDQASRYSDTLRSPARPDSLGGKTARAESPGAAVSRDSARTPASRDSSSRPSRPDSAGARAPGAPGPGAGPDSIPPPTPPPGSRTDALIRQGDSAAARLEPVGALDAYQKAVATDPSSYEALWKAGRTLIDLGELEGRGNSQKDKYNKALKYADRAVKVNPDGADGHFVRAYALGRVALFEGGKTKLRLARDIKAEALRAIDLNPLQDGAYHILGQWNYDLSGLNFVERVLAKTILGGIPPDASLENAAHYFQLAIQANPDHINHHLAYALALIKLDRKDEARVELQKALDLPARDLDDPAHKEEARELLKRSS